MLIYSEGKYLSEQTIIIVYIFTEKVDEDKEKSLIVTSPLESGK